MKCSLFMRMCPQHELYRLQLQRCSSKVPSVALQHFNLSNLCTIKLLLSISSYM